jgi:hypothetical protein
MSVLQKRKATRRNVIKNIEKQITDQKKICFGVSENRRVEQVLPGLVPVGGEGRNGRVKMVQILCAHVCKWKNDTC